MRSVRQILGYRNRDDTSDENTKSPTEYDAENTAANRPTKKSKTGFKATLATLQSNGSSSSSSSSSSSPPPVNANELVRILTFAMHRDEIRVAIPITNQKCENHLGCTIDRLVQTATHKGGKVMDSVDALNILATYLIRQGCWTQ